MHYILRNTVKTAATSSLGMSYKTSKMILQEENEGVNMLLQNNQKESGLPMEHKIQIGSKCPKMVESITKEKLE